MLSQRHLLADQPAPPIRQTSGGQPLYVARPSTDPSHVAAQTFDAIYRTEYAGQGAFARVLRTVDPTLPRDVEPFSFLSGNLLRHIDRELALPEEGILVDLGCGTGGPGLWLVRATRARLVGVDFSMAAIARARERATMLGQPADFVVARIEASGLRDGAADAVVAVDSMQYPESPSAAVIEARRILRPGGRLVLTGWHPCSPGDLRVAEHRYADWPALLCKVGFADIALTSKPAWTKTYLNIYRAALTIEDSANHTALNALKDEARRRLPTAHLLRRVAITATASVRP